MINTTRKRTKLELGGDAAFVLVIIAAYGVIFASGVLAYPISLLVIVLGLVFIAVGLFGWRHLIARPTALGKALYFFVQISLGAAIQYLCDGNAWLLFLPMAAHAVAIFPVGWSIFVCSLIFATLMMPFILYSSIRVLLSVGFNMIAALFFVFIFTRVAMNEEKARAEAERLATELEQANRKLREYAVKAEDLAVSKERTRMAREIHDGLGHHLTAINMQIKAALAVLDDNRESARGLLEKSQGLAQDALVEVRRSVAALRDDPAMDKPLSESLRDLLDDVRGSGIVAELTVVGKAVALPDWLNFALYRIAQEGLTNMRKHALASRVDLTLDYSEPGWVRLALGDNGVGSANTEGGFGLLGIRERVQLLNGRLDIQTDVGKGFCIDVAIPFGE